MPPARPRPVPCAISPRPAGTAPTVAGWRICRGRAAPSNCTCGSAGSAAQTPCVRAGSSPSACRRSPCPRRAGRSGCAPFNRRFGLALGGEQGSWLAGRLAMPLSPATLLRLIRAIDLKPPGTPRVIGVDDWAFRRGQHYGTIICDLEQPRTLELLPDRQAETLEAWLKAHPSVEIVARDRAGAYADGIRKGAPKAIQVADRFHLLCHCSDALKEVFDRKHREVRRAFEAAAHAAVPAPSPEPPPAPVIRAADRAHDRALQRQARYEEVARLHAAGLPIRRIARELGLGRKTVRRWLRAGQAPAHRKPGRPKLIDRHRDDLERRWQEGCHNGSMSKRGR